MAIKVILFIVFILGILIFAGLAGWRAWKAYDDDAAKWPAILFGVISLVMIGCTILIPGNIHQVNTGEVAIVRHMGTVTGVRNPGVYWDWYFTNDYEIYNTKVISVDFSQEETASYSKDNQVISFDLNIQYRIPNNEVKYVAENIGSTNALKDVISPKMLDATKTVIGTKGAEEIIQLRETVATVIKESLAKSFPDGTFYTNENGETVSNQFITIREVNIKNIEFTPDFEAAVAAKVAADQEAQKAEIEARKAEIEAEAARKVAEKEAEAALYKAQKEAAAELAKAQADAEAQLLIANAEAKATKVKAVEVARMLGFNIIENPTTDGIEYEIDFSGIQPDDARYKLMVNYLEYIQYLETWDGTLPVTLVGDGSATVLIPSTN